MAGPIQVSTAHLGTLPPLPPRTHHEDDGDQIGEVGWEPVFPGQLHLVCLQHEQGWVSGGDHPSGKTCVCTYIWA